jgi:GNAT superfamily N-acetyltransferase
MDGMPPSPSAVAAASAAWIWIPDDATVVETAEYTILRPPDYFDYQLAVIRFRPSGPLGAAVDQVIERARAFGLPAMQWHGKLADPDGLADELAARGATVETLLDVLAIDLAGGEPELTPPAVDVSLRWAIDFETSRDGSAVAVSGFGGEAPPDERIEENAAADAATVFAGQGGMLVGYVDGLPAGSGGVTVVDGVARLWGGVVVPSQRGQGVYRAVLGARLAYAADHGATMALVKGKVDTSAPILRKAGFSAFGQEPVYRVPL